MFFVLSGMDSHHWDAVMTKPKQNNRHIVQNMSTPHIKQWASCKNHLYRRRSGRFQWFKRICDIDHISLCCIFDSWLNCNASLTFFCILFAYFAMIMIFVVKFSPSCCLILIQSEWLQSFSLLSFWLYCMNLVNMNFKQIGFIYTECINLAIV